MNSIANSKGFVGPGLDTTHSTDNERKKIRSAGEKKNCLFYAFRFFCYTKKHNLLGKKDMKGDMYFIL